MELMKNGLIKTGHLYSVTDRKDMVSKLQTSTIGNVANLPAGAEHHITSLQYLAHLCEPLYKETVVLARNMLSSLQVHQTYNDQELCAVLENRKTDKVQVASVSIYPNPSTGVFYINSASRILSYEVKDISGQQFISVDRHETKCDLTDLNAGIYFIILHLENGDSITKKIVKLQ